MLIGLGFVLLAMPWYVSFENHSVLGRWSPTYVGAMVALAACGLVLWFVGVRRAARAEGSGSTELGTRLIGYGSAIWGAGYAVAAIGDVSQAANILELNLAGSVNPIGILLDWLGPSLAVAGAIALAATRCPPRFRNALTLLASTVATVLVMEGAARLKALAAPSTEGFPTHSEEIWRRRHATMNSLGFRDVEPGPPGSDARRRVAIVGDSYGFGWGIEKVDDRFGERLAGDLSASTSDEWVSLNASRPDTHTLQHIDFLTTILEFDPDVVVLLYVFNDVDYLRRVTVESDLATRGGGLSSRLRPKRVLFVNSYLYQELLVRWRAIRNHSTPSGDSDPYLDDAIVTRHIADLTHFVAVAAAAGKPVRIVPFDVGVVASPEIRHRYETFMAALVEGGLDVCSLLDAFDGRDFRSLTVNALDVHPNADAHRLAADFVASCVADAVYTL
jgi:lysophospholipase L1-like esterase